mgnify:CR=1 FL=1
MLGLRAQYKQIIIVLVVLVGLFFSVPPTWSKNISPDTGGPPIDIQIELLDNDNGNIVASNTINYSFSSIKLTFVANPSGQSFNNAVRIERCGSANYEWLTSERLSPNPQRYGPWDKGTLSGCEGSYPVINWDYPSDSVWKVCAGASDSYVNPANFYDHPNNRCYRVWRTSSGISYRAIFDISGKITDSNGNAISNVTVALSNGKTATTNSNGNYRFDNIDSGTYSIAPNRTNYTFTPSSRTVTGPRQPLNTTPDVTGQNFTMLFAQPIPAPQPPPSSCPVPFYWQKDSRWAGNHFGTCSCTIGKCGCALTSLAMTFKYFGANQNPATLAACLGRKACPLAWSASCSSGKVSFRGSTSFSWSRLEQEIAKGRLVILRLDKPNTTHFVVVVSGSGNNPRNYLVNDPALRGGARVRLSAVLARGYSLGSGSTAMRIWSGTPNCQNVFSDNESELAIPSLHPSTTQPVTGTIILYHNTETTMTLQLAAESLNGNVVDMLIWTDSLNNTIWQPFAEYVELPLSEQFFVQFRDEVGVVSEIVNDYSAEDFSESIDGPDLYEIFLPLTLRQ